MALAFLLAAVASLIAGIVYLLIRPGRYTLWERLIYCPVYVVARVLWRVEIEWRSQEGWEEGPQAVDQLLSDRLAGGAILLANHRCSLDPFFVQLISGKRVHWMVAGEYFKNAWIGPILRSYEAIPTNRGGVDFGSTKRAIALTKQGRFVGMFPEGRINRTKEPLLSIRPGAAIIALRAKVPLIPIWIEGAPRGWEVYSALFTPARVRVIVGRPEHYEQFASTLPPSIVSAASDATDGASSDEPNRQRREEAALWMKHVTGRLLTLGGHGSEGVSMAGRNWLHAK